jgi:CheY-like chemotaxis protein
MNVLVVEDEILIADYICEVLEDAGLSVFGVAESAEHALRMVDSSGPDVALVDVKLAGPMDGIEFAQAMRQRHSAPVIFVTGSGDPTTLARIESVSPFARLQKPVRPDQLVSTVLAAGQGNRA